MNEQELLTISELSQKLKVAASWLYSKTRESGENSIPVLRVGKYLRFHYDSVIEWLKKYGQK